MTFNRLRRRGEVGFGDGHSERVGRCKEVQVVTAVQVVLYGIDSGLGMMVRWGQLGYGLAK